MNIALIYAGGQGSRLYNYSRPKQFLEYRGKPILIYTIGLFQAIAEIDGIVVVCLEDWIPYLKSLIKENRLTKVVEVVPGGKSGQDSIYKGLECAARHYPDDTLVMIHDGVRPLAMAKTIVECIAVAKKKGNCVVCVPAMETVILRKPDGGVDLPVRDSCLLGRAPQCFRLSEVLDAHRRAQAEDRHDFVDTCTMMHHYGHRFHTILGSFENIKITTPADYFMFQAIMKSREEESIFGF